MADTDGKPRRRVLWIDTIHISVELFGDGHTEAEQSQSDQTTATEHNQQRRAKSENFGTTSGAMYNKDSAKLFPMSVNTNPTCYETLHIIMSVSEIQCCIQKVIQGV
jgi:hypothetical protein